jgi:hypothetical protein
MRSTTPEILSAATASRKSPAIGARSAMSWTTRFSVSISSRSISLSRSTRRWARFRVALDEAAHCLDDGLLRQLAHLADEPAKAVDVLVKGLERMAGLLLHCFCSDQP